MRILRAPQRPAGAALALAALTTLALSGCANKTGPSGSPSSGSSSNSAKPGAGDIVVGAYGTMTGQDSTFGTSTAAGFKLALDAANGAGGINGHKLAFAEGQQLDDEGQPDKARTVVNKIVSSDNPTAVLGEVSSGRSLAAGPVCDQAKVPMISPSSTNPAVTKPNYVFRVCFTDDFQGYAEAKFAHDTLKFTRAAILEEVTNPYSTGLAKVFKASFTKLGGTVVDDESYSHGDTDFKAALTKIKAANPQIIQVPGYYGDIGPIARQARQVGLTVPLIGGDGWDSSKLVEGAGGPGQALEGSYFSDHYSVTSTDPAVQKFVADYKAANGGTVPDSNAALAYDAAGLMIDAIKRTPAPADGNYGAEAYRVKLRDAIASTKGYKGVTGTITIGPDRNAVKPASILQIKGAQFNLAATVAPEKS